MGAVACGCDSERNQISVFATPRTPNLPDVFATPKIFVTSTTLLREEPALTKPVRIDIIAPPLASLSGLMSSRRATIETDEQETVLVVLEKVSLHLGLELSDASSLQLQAGGITLAHELGLKVAGLYDGAECWVLGVEEATTRKVDVVVAVGIGNEAALRLVCQHAPDMVNDKNEVPIHTCY